MSTPTVANVLEAFAAELSSISGVQVRVGAVDDGFAGLTIFPYSMGYDAAFRTVTGSKEADLTSVHCLVTCRPDDAHVQLSRVGKTLQDGAALDVAGAKVTLYTDYVSPEFLAAIFSAAQISLRLSHAILLRWHQPSS